MFLRILSFSQQYLDTFLSLTLYNSNWFFCSVQCIKVLRILSELMDSSWFFGSKEMCRLLFIVQQNGVWATFLTMSFYQKQATWIFIFFLKTITSLLAPLICWTFTTTDTILWHLLCYQRNCEDFDSDWWFIEIVINWVLCILLISSWQLFTSKRKLSCL